MQLVNDLHAAEAAERTAADLRRRYGADAEAWCDKLLATLPPRDDRRVTVKNIRRALRWAPVSLKQARA